ncbi:hypothetical protein FC83_GL002634 [Agrilactobacillus composti DSM 18527 = JCM 14202]|uniref:Periplasmic secreted protein n=1 Tax=Agrilactobacillus composti DSM 18527 = JCM 14202 TaxID=1423734 RepID=X0PUR2_9LACO|nr:DUF1440 domain-containing protein [Agrilactobacillus composti]KRM36757.1 hypothetical protein FC83_GL002634 [Agrilactobacillus composti DSM 18527 = JCM 14202]GAF41867.1 hypothetical protein JCM14202_3831 [Agrilactobacillus composti DSM 18527 = JCM 14202]
MAKFNIWSAVAAGTAAGIVAGMVKMGWENILPPRTPARDATNPPQRTLEMMGISPEAAHATYSYNGHDLPWPSYLVHYTFSTGFGIAYTVLGHYFPIIKTGHGLFFGLAAWAGAHLYTLPKMGVIPAAADQPVEEHVSEALGHMLWMWSIDAIGNTFYERMTALHQDQD